MRKALARFGRRIHIKTAGTTWLEELIGLAEGMANVEARKGDYLAPGTRRRTFGLSFGHRHLTGANCPVNSEGWSSEQFVSALRHDPANKDYNRQFVSSCMSGYKIAENMGIGICMLKGMRRLGFQKRHNDLYDRHLNRCSSTEQCAATPAHRKGFECLVFEWLIICH